MRSLTARRFCFAISVSNAAVARSAVLPAMRGAAVEAQYVTPLVSYLCSEECEHTHEIFDVGAGHYARAFVGQVHEVLKPSSRLLVLEPRGHVSREAFEMTLAHARETGFRELEPPQFRGERTALLEKRARTN